MPRKALVLTAWLAASIACRDAPTTPGPAGVGPVERPVVVVSGAAVHTAMEMLDDPFVRDLMRDTGVPFAALERAMRDATSYGGQQQIEALARVIAETRSGLMVASQDAQEGTDQAILRAAVAFVLEDAARWLERDAEDSRDEDDTRLRNPGQY